MMVESLKAKNGKLKAKTRKNLFLITTCNIFHVFVVSCSKQFYERLGGFSSLNVKADILTKISSGRFLFFTTR